MSRPKTGIVNGVKEDQPRRYRGTTAMTHQTRIHVQPKYMVSSGSKAPTIDEMCARSKKMSLIEAMNRGLFQHALYIVTLRPSCVATDRDERRRNGLMLCAYVGDEKWRRTLVQTFLQQNIDFEERDVDLKNVLHHAGDMLRNDMITMLLNAGCQHLLHSKDRLGKRPIDYVKHDPICCRAIQENSEINLPMPHQPQHQEQQQRAKRKARPYSAIADLYPDESRRELKWSTFEKKTQCPTLIDAMAFAPSLRDNLDVQSVDTGDLPSSTVYHVQESPASSGNSTAKGGDSTRRNGKKKKTINYDLTNAFDTSSPMATLLMLHGERSQDNFKQTTKTSSDHTETLFRNLRLHLEYQQQEDQDFYKNNGKKSVGFLSPLSSIHWLRYLFSYYPCLVPFFLHAIAYPFLWISKFFAQRKSKLYSAVSSRSRSRVSSAMSVFSASMQFQNNH